eukprot:TRINITY_DN17182_c0_g2_i1.p1 TRINITY_DN17182_c0_g2~~TRINITY_DN17182_c0_g2_i1.p1  ORF type:complete len:426 (+),score=40.72 TRINITY_DN17182_c0_g2_i1:75-1352(+)
MARSYPPPRQPDVPPRGGRPAGGGTRRACVLRFRVLGDRPQPHPLDVKLLDLVFSQSGQPVRMLIERSGTTGLVEMLAPAQASRALADLRSREIWEDGPQLHLEPSHESVDVRCNNEHSWDYTQWLPDSASGTAADGRGDILADGDVLPDRSAFANRRDSRPDRGRGDILDEERVCVPSRTAPPRQPARGHDMRQPGQVQARGVPPPTACTRGPNHRPVVVLSGLHARPCEYTGGQAFDLERLYVLCGTVGNVHSIKILENRQSALVEYASTEHAANACAKLDGCMVFGTRVTATPSNKDRISPPNGEDPLFADFSQRGEQRFGPRCTHAKVRETSRAPTACLFVSGFPDWVAEVELMEIMQPFRPEFAEVQGRWKDKRRGEGHVTFPTPAEATAALMSTHGRTRVGRFSFDGLELRVAFSTARR